MTKEDTSSGGSASETGEKELSETAQREQKAMSEVLRIVQGNRPEEQKRKAISDLIRKSYGTAKRKPGVVMRDPTPEDPQPTEES